MGSKASWLLHWLGTRAAGVAGRLWGGMKVGHLLPTVLSSCLPVGRQQGRREGGRKGRRNERAGGKERRKAEGSGCWQVRGNIHAVLLCAGVKVSCREIVETRVPVFSPTASPLPPLDMAECLR